MKISHSIAGLLLASALTVSHAAILPLSSGALPTTIEKLNTVIDADGGFSAYFGHAFVLEEDYAKFFTNDYTFNITPSGISAGSLTATFVADKKDVYISAFNIYTEGGKLVSTGINTGSKSDQTKAIDTWIMPETALAGPGAYYLEVTGQVLGRMGGSYGGEMSVTASPVPEPGALALMGSGLGLIGFMTRRRKRML